MCCEGKSAKDAYAPTGTYLDRTQKDTFAAHEVADAEGVSFTTIMRLVRAGAFGSLVYYVGGSVRIPRLAVIHFHEQGRVTSRAAARKVTP